MLTNKYFCLNYTKYLLKIAQNCKKVPKMLQTTAKSAIFAAENTKILQK